MPWTEDFYSQLVAWMKIILPVAALGLLSTLFLISRTVDPTRQPITSQIDLEQRAHDQGITRPSFAGVTRDGDQVRFEAARARPDLDDPEHLIAEDITAELRLFGGGVVDITAQSADMYQGKYTASLHGNVVIETTTGYHMRTDRLNARYDTLYASSPGPVRGWGPPGQITAGKMLLTADTESGDAEVIFTDQVKLIYTPAKPEE